MICQVDIVVLSYHFDGFYWGGGQQSRNEERGGVMRFRADGYADMRGLTCSEAGFTDSFLSSPVALFSISERVLNLLFSGPSHNVI